MRAGLGLSKCSINGIYYPSQRVCSALGGPLGSPSLSFWVTGGTVWPPGYVSPLPLRVSGVGTCRAGISVSDPLSRVALSSVLLVKWMLLGPLATTVSSPTAAVSHLPCSFSLNFYFPIALCPSYKEAGLASPNWNSLSLLANLQKLCL